MLHRPRIRVLAGLLLAALLLMLGGPLWLPGVGRFLEVDQPLQPADAIVVLAGNSPGRLEHGYALYQAGYAPLLIVSDERLRSHGMDLTWRTLHEAGLVLANLPDERLLVLDPPPESTVDEARRSAAALTARGARSAILVTDPFHSRRALWLFQAEYRRAGLTVSSSPSRGRIDLSRWWQSSAGVLTVVQEYVKLLAYIPQGSYL